MYIHILCLKKEDVIHNSNGRKSIYSSNFFYPSIYFVFLNFHEFENWFAIYLFTRLETMGSDLIFIICLPWFLLNQGKISSNLTSYVKIMRLTKVSFTNSRFVGFDTKNKNQQKLLKC